MTTSESAQVLSSLGRAHVPRGGEAGAGREVAERASSRRSVRNGWLAVARTSLPEARRRRNTSRVPVGNTCVMVERT